MDSGRALALWCAALLVLSGCSIGSPAPQPAVRTPAAKPVVPPETVAARRSVVHILGTAPSCGKQFEGTGFVYAPERVVTPAHVVAGVVPTSHVVTTEDGKPHVWGRVVAYDPDVDVAVLYVPGLAAPPLPIADVSAADGHLLGYPKGAQQPVLQPVKTKRRIEAEGPNFYRDRQVTRMVLPISGDIEPGMSGAPLIVSGGRVAGMVFATAEKEAGLAYTLPSEELLPIVERGRKAKKRVSTQKCD